MTRNKSSAIVVLSGGQDSTTCLYWAMNNFDFSETLTFDYGQRHRVELDAAQKIAKIAGVKNTILPIDSFGALGGNSLTGNEEVDQSSTEGELPNSFVPGRNLIFLTLAAAFAYQREVKDLVTGVCQCYTYS